MKKIKTPLSLTLRFLFLIVTSLLVASCTTTAPMPKARGGVITLATPEPVPLTRQNIYHTVGPGETLWRISQMYDVDIAAIKKANSITDVRDIDIGKKLLIPGAAYRKEVVTLYPSTRWKYIIVHHSATDIGSSAMFDKAHKNKGWEGVGYDFVIDNGTYGKGDGQIETTPRWTRQETGAHCKAGGMNEKGIGICLVGNFSSGHISSSQMRSLIYLVKLLQDYYHIPSSNVIGHGKVPGAQTECPGRQFPWKTFYSNLKR